MVNPSVDLLSLQRHLSHNPKDKTRGKVISNRLFFLNEAPITAFPIK